MKKSSTFENCLTILGAIIFAAAIIIFLPFIAFWVAYFGGWIASLIIGDTLCYALNTLFHSAYFTKDMLPWCAGALGWIGGYFKSVATVKDKK